MWTDIAERGSVQLELVLRLWASLTTAPHRFTFTLSMYFPHVHSCLPPFRRDQGRRIMDLGSSISPVNHHVLSRLRDVPDNSPCTSRHRCTSRVHC